MKRFLFVAAFLCAAVLQSRAQSVTTTATQGTISGQATLTVGSFGGSGYSYTVTYKYTGTYNASAGIQIASPIYVAFTQSTTDVVHTSGANALTPGSTVSLTVNTIFSGGQTGTATNTLTVPAAPPTPKKMPFTFHNPTEVPAVLNVYKVDASGNTIFPAEATISVAPGRFYSGEADIGDGLDRRIIPVWNNAQMDFSGGGAGRIVTGSGIISGNTINFPNSAMTTATGAGGQYVAPTNVNQAQVFTNVNSGTTNVYSGGTTASQVFNSTQVASTTGATNGQIAASSNEIIKAINQSGQVVAAAVGASSGGGSGTDMSGVHSRLDTISGKLTDQATLNSRAKTADDAAIAAAGGMSAAADAVGDGGHNAVMGLASAPAVSQTAGGSSSGFAFALFGTSYNFDPNNYPWLVSVAAWIKSFIQLIVCGFYINWIWTMMLRMVGAMAQAPQARGNTVAGSGGQITGTIAAGVITAVIGSAIPALWALADAGTLLFSSFFGGTMTDVITTSSNSYVSMALHLLWFFLPVHYILVIITHVIFFKQAALALLVYVTMVIRMINP